MNITPINANQYNNRNLRRNYNNLPTFKKEKRKKRS